MNQPQTECPYRAKGIHRCDLCKGSTVPPKGYPPVTGVLIASDDDENDLPYCLCIKCYNKHFSNYRDELRVVAMRDKLENET